MVLPASLWRLSFDIVQEVLPRIEIVLPQQRVYRLGLIAVSRQSPQQFREEACRGNRVARASAFPDAVYKSCPIAYVRMMYSVHPAS